MRRLSLLSLCTAALVPAAWAQHGQHAPTDTRADVSAAVPAAVRRPPMARTWTQQPVLLPARATRGERAQAMLQAQGISASALTVYAAAGPADRRQVDYPLDAAGGRIEAATPKIGNYHWVVARAETPEIVTVASTAWYFGNPGESPQDLLQTPKHELEIVPQPLPREHGSYRESEKWRFLVRFHGQPLAGQSVKLETEFGSRTSFVTDAAGFATVLFPRDFRPTEKQSEGASHGPRRAQFVLATEKEAEGRRYLTAFNLSYGPDGDRDRSLGWGAAFGLAGMLAATPLLRRKDGAPGDAKNA